MSDQVTPALRERLGATKAASFTGRRMDAIIGRFYSLSLVLATVEITINALEQQAHLNEPMFWVIFGAYLLATVALVISTWWGEASSLWYIVHALVILGCVAVWPLVVVNPGTLPHGFTPFVWWMTGWGGLSAGLGFNRILAPLYIATLPVVFGVIEMTQAGGTASLLLAVQNAVYTFLISAVVIGVVWFLRERAKQQDIASVLAAQVAAATAAESAVSAERSKIAAMVHTDVLSALNAAIDAHSPDERKVAATLAETAIRRLSNYENEVSNQSDSATVDVFFDALAELVKSLNSNFEVTSSVDGELTIPLTVANALTEATLQSVNNSLVHAGGSRVKRSISLRASKGALKIVIMDDGVGFRPSRVPKNRLGIKMIIRRRIEEVGAVSKVQSNPGQGTTIILEWNADD